MAVNTYVRAAAASTLDAYLNGDVDLRCRRQDLSGRLSFHSLAQHRRTRLSNDAPLSVKSQLLNKSVSYRQIDPYFIAAERISAMTEMSGLFYRPSPYGHSVVILASVHFFPPTFVAWQGTSNANQKSITTPNDIVHFQWR